MDARSLRSVAQLADELPAFDEPALRRLIFNADHNGLSRAIVRVGRRVLIDLNQFNAWLESRRQRERSQGQRRAAEAWRPAL